MAVMRSEEPRAPSPGGGGAVALVPATGAGAQSSSPSSSPSPSDKVSLPPAYSERVKRRTQSRLAGDVEFLDHPLLTYLTNAWRVAPELHMRRPSSSDFFSISCNKN